MKIKMIYRSLETQIRDVLGGEKAITLMGARQVGKSTLLRMLLSDRNDVLWLNGDDPDIQGLFSQMTAVRFRTIIGNNRIVVVDEAQRIPDIGLRLKLVTDQIPNVQVIATGSSSFELASKVNESLTGRKREFRMFPLTFQEMVNHTDFLTEMRLIPHRMVYGYYPEVVSNPSEERVILKELTDSYLYKDILSLDAITKSDKLISLLKALALQIGSQVSYREVGMLVGLDPKTVERYIDILEKSYVVFRVGAFARNIRNELKTTKKIYFWDLGIRNALIGNLAQIEGRQDVGALWENFMIAERMKQNIYQGRFVQTYFWRTKQQQEIDWIEEEDGVLSAYEFKWNGKKTGTRCPDSFANAYPDTKYHVIVPSNIEMFLGY